jgi:hypothetical protein
MMFLNTVVTVKMNNLKRLYTQWFSNTVQPSRELYFHLRSLHYPSFKHNSRSRSHLLRRRVQTKNGGCTSRTHVEEFSRTVSQNCASGLLMHCSVIVYVVSKLYLYIKMEMSIYNMAVLLTHSDEIIIRTHTFAFGLAYGRESGGICDVSRQ